MDDFLYRIISLFFIVCWFVFQYIIIDVITDAKPDSNNILRKIISLSIFLGVCAFLGGMCLGYIN